MGSIRLLALAVVTMTLFNACSAQFSARYRMSDCPSLEGYPDCQDGFRVPPDPGMTGYRPASERAYLPLLPAQTP